jgi:hypothetical protein
MTTKIKIQYDQQSKCVTASAHVESDTLSPDDVLKLSTELAIKAMNEAQGLSMRFSPR